MSIGFFRKRPLSMTELEELFDIKKKHTKKREIDLKNFVKEEKVKTFLQRKAIETNSIKKLEIIGDCLIRKNYNNPMRFLDSIGTPYCKLKNAKMIGESKNREQPDSKGVWSKDSGWINLQGLKKVLSPRKNGSECYLIPLGGSVNIQVETIFLLVYQNLIKNYSEKYGDFDIYEFIKIQRMSTGLNRSHLSIYDIYESCNFNPPQICPITGEKIDWRNFGKRNNKNSPTIDKILPSLGYETGNVKIISHFGNALKHCHDLGTLRRTIKYLEDCQTEKLTTSESNYEAPKVS